MNNTNNNLKLPKRFNNSSNLHKLRKNITINSSQKYRNAVMNLREGLNELENLDNDNLKNVNNRTIKNERLSTYIFNTNNLNIMTEGSGKNSYIGRYSGKNVTPKYNNSLKTSANGYPINIKYNTIENNFNKITKLNPQKNSRYKYLSSAFEKAINSENNQNNQNNIVILKKQNILYRKKINELMNNMNVIKGENQRLNNDKNNLMKKIELYETELIKNKEQNSELENKNNNIMKLKNDIVKLNILLNKKKEEISVLKNKINNIKGSEIKTLDDKIDSINISKENQNINELINQNNSLKNQLQICQTKILNMNNSFKIAQNENQKRVNDLTKKLNILKAEKEKFEKMKDKINENNELRNKIINLEKQNNLILNDRKNFNINNSEEFNLLKKDLESKKKEIDNLNENIVNLTLDLNKQKNYNDVLAKDIFALRGEIDKYKEKEFALEEENLSKQCIIEDLNKKNIELKNKLNLTKSQNNINNNESNNILNNIESLFSSKIKALEKELKEKKDKYQQNLEKIEKLSKKQIEMNKINNYERKDSSDNKNTISFPSSIKNNFTNNNKKNNSESEENIDKLKKDAEEERCEIEQLEKKLNSAKDMELKRLIYTEIENKGRGSQSQEEENNMQNSSEKKNIFNINMISSQLSDLLKVNILSNENQSNKINDEAVSIKKDLEEKKNEISNLNEKIKELENDLKSEKNNNKDLTNINKNLKEEIEKLNIKVSELTTENINNQQQILDLSNTNNILKIRVNSVHSGNFKLNAFRSEEHNQELEKQIQQLQQKNDDLQEKINLLGKASNTNENMLKLIEEKQNISKENLKLVAENLDLKNELLILKLQINENGNEDDTISGNEKYLMDIESNIVKELEKKLDDAKNEYEESLEELKRKENLYKQKDTNINNIKDQDDEEESIDSNDIDELKKEIKDKKLKIEQLEKQLTSIKNTEVTKMLNKYVLDHFQNNKNQEMEENNEIKEQQIKLMKNDSSIMDKEENMNISTINKLKEEINEKDKQIELLLEENNNLKNNMNNKLEEEEQNEINININKKENEIDIEKYKLLKNQVIELKELNNSDKMQIKTLKEEIKELKERLKKIETFSGQLNNFNEFIKILQSALLNYKPKKKEQKVALDRLKEILNNHHL